MSYTAETRLFTTWPSAEVDKLGGGPSKNGYTQLVLWPDTFVTAEIVDIISASVAAALKSNIPPVFAGCISPRESSRVDACFLVHKDDFPMLVMGMRWWNQLSFTEQLGYPEPFRKFANTLDPTA